MFAIKFVGFSKIQRFTLDKLSLPAVSKARYNSFELRKLAQLKIQTLATYTFEH